MRGRIPSLTVVHTTWPAKMYGRAQCLLTTVWLEGDGRFVRVPGETSFITAVGRTVDGGYAAE